MVLVQTRIVDNWEFPTLPSNIFMNGEGGYLIVSKSDKSMRRGSQTVSA